MKSLESSSYIRLPSNGGPDQRILCVEAYWNDVVLSEGGPNAWRVWAWALAIGPYLLVQSTALGMVAGFTAGMSRSWGSSQKSYYLSSSPRMLMGIIWRAVLFPPVLVLLMVIGTFTLAFEALKQGFSTGKSATRGFNADRSIVARCCKYVVGDAWAFAQDDKVLEEVLSRIHATVSETRMHASRVTIVGHSQGAALSRILLHREAGLADGLVTVGSGANILGISRASRRRHIAIGWTWMLVYPILLLAGGAHLFETLASSLWDLLKQLQQTLSATGPLLRGETLGKLSQTRWRPSSISGSRT